MVQLFLRLLDSSSQVLDVPECCSVDELRQVVEDRCQVPAEALSLVHAGRLLQDGQPLHRYGVARDSTIHVLLRLRGGKGGFGALLRGMGREGKKTDNFDACRDLSGRRIREATTAQKLQEWQAQAKERELEKVAEKHIKALAKAAKAEQARKVDVEQVAEEHREAAARVQESVQSALTVGLAAGGSGKADGANKRKAAQEPAGGRGSSAAGPADATGAKRSRMLPLYGDGENSDSSAESDKE